MDFVGGWGERSRVKSRGRRAMVSPHQRDETLATLQKRGCLAFFIFPSQEENGHDDKMMMNYF